MQKQLILNQLQTVFEESPDAILILDYDFKIQNYNPAFSKLFLFKDNSKADFVHLFSDSYKKKIIEDLHYVIDNGKLQACEYSFYNNNQTEIFVEVSYKLIDKLDDKSNYLLVFIRDISRRKINENALKEAKQRAENADKLKSSFLANMSHEIRTPINAIMGFSDLLDDEFTSSEERKEYTKIINANGEGLLHLINDIIDVAKIESNQLKINYQKFSLSDLFFEIHQSMLEYMNNLKPDSLDINYHIDDNLKNVLIETDEFRLRQVLVNLVSNSIKFTNEGYVNYKVETKNNKLLFIVSDTGIGLSEKDKNLIFDRFRQVESGVKGGAGLGLSITKNIVNLLKGKIWLESELGKGTSFYFTLPNRVYDNENESISKSKLNKYEELKDKNILIVEDSEANFQLLDVILKKHKANTIWASRGKQAVSICENNMFIDLILMDINLPDINGYECTQIIKSTNPNIPIIAQTAFAMAGEKEISAEFGCDDYISKPIEAAKLLNIILNYI